MNYDRDLRKVRRLAIALALVNFAACGFALHRRDWFNAFTSAIWSLTCCAWLATIHAQQKARDWARIHEAGLRELKRQIDRGLLE